MMLDEDIARNARIRAHRNNIHRYRRLLGTKLSDNERRFIMRRLGEESAAFAGLTAASFPVAPTLSKDPSVPETLR